MTFRGLSLTSPPTIAMLAALLLAPHVATSAPQDRDNMFEAYRGLYRAGPDHVVGVNPFITDDGTPTMLYSDYRSGVVRRLFETSRDEFVVGAGFNTASPVEIAVTFVREDGQVTGMVLRPATGAETVAPRLPLTEQEVAFESGDAWRPASSTRCAIGFRRKCSFEPCRRVRTKCAQPETADGARYSHPDRAPYGTGRKTVRTRGAPPALESRTCTARTV